ncbi:YIP1 family protein [Pedobacter rhodius]|uniref:YIP1 family protein n=1 Tax=Pedobacter rhodius TaxID=3004098 RepID=A0ABT4KTL5_9SPHI|nr:YIP1 family protein [Pedobacter sp. SJ11]MCZ4222255.1 YIP1 family protein [Pedobacter sp. SJ11]
MSALKYVWFTASSLFKWPERTFAYIVNRLGDEQKNLLMGIYLTVNWLNALVITKPEKILEFFLGSCFILPISFFVLLFVYKIGSTILVFLVDRFGDKIDDFNAELVVIYSSLPVWICFSILALPLKLIDLDNEIFVIIPLIYQGYLLYKGSLTLTNLSQKNAVFVSFIYVTLPFLLHGLLTVVVLKVWN